MYLFNENKLELTAAMVRQVMPMPVFYDLAPASIGKKSRPKEHSRRLSIYGDFELSEEKIGGFPCFFTRSGGILK